MTYTRLQYCQMTLSQLGVNDSFSFPNYWLCAWSLFESQAPNAALYNIFNTTLKAPDSSDYNSAGVQNYTSLEEGVSYFLSTLTSGSYQYIVNALKADSINAGDYLNSYVGAELSLWGTGVQHQQDIYNLALALESGTDKRSIDPFSDTSGNNNTNMPMLLFHANGNLLVVLDQLMVLKNPLNINADMVSIGSISIQDPLKWFNQFGANIISDSVSIIIRLIVIVLGTILLWKSLGTIIKVRKV